MQANAARSTECCERINSYSCRKQKKKHISTGHGVQGEGSALELDALLDTKKNLDVCFIYDKVKIYRVAQPRMNACQDATAVACGGRACCRGREEKCFRKRKSPIAAITFGATPLSIVNGWSAHFVVCEINTSNDKSKNKETWRHIELYMICIGEFLRFG